MDDTLATTVLVPTLWRAHHLEPFLTSLYDHAGSIPVQPLFLCQEDDRPTLVELDQLGADRMVFPSFGRKPQTMVSKVNAAFHTITTPFLFGASDDIRFLPDTLERCHEALSDPTLHAACVSDGIAAHNHGGELTGHCLVRTSYITEESGVLDEPATILHPGYFHYYSDLEFMSVARMRGVYVSLFDARIDHPHANAGTAELDRVQHWSIERRRADRLTFQRRAHMWQQVSA